MNPYLKALWIVLVIVAGFFILPHSFPILLALVSAIVLEPIVKLLQRSLKFHRIYAVIIAFTSFLLVFGGLLFFITTRIVIEVVELSQWLPRFVLDMADPVREWVAEIQDYFATLPPGSAQNLQAALNKTFASLNDLTITLLNGLVGLISALPNLMVVSVVYIVALFLFSLDLPALVKKFLALFDETTQPKVLVVLKNLNRAIIGFLQAQILISFLTYDLVLIGLWILGVKYALAVALIIVIVDVLPVLGTGAVIVPWAAYVFVTGNNSLAVGLMILYMAIVIFRRIIEPKILGNSLGISALATLVSMYLGFMVFGVIGLIAGPALIILYQALRDAGFFHIRIKL
ncbi:sporulation integral membrane protein YtvI [Tumebacillus algifaecis]|uniref:Sporulation integral membrane protein YtvI n=1 Tax=Tumebacillus algifaecis TaxID=1214604 RepID=A0A223D3M5_9BACL|nr:sporulation integral membrane protein YtvI [Tumebacillus algifaecis]ASS76181.1 sporulation integral membrane protein YtvI [Tumebacillus algifaecis]